MGVAKADLVMGGVGRMDAGVGGGVSGQRGAFPERFGTNSGAEPERGERFGEVGEETRFGVEGGEVTE